MVYGFETVGNHRRRKLFAGPREEERETTIFDRMPFSILQRTSYLRDVRLGKVLRLPMGGNFPKSRRYYVESLPLRHRCAHSRKIATRTLVCLSMILCFGDCHLAVHRWDWKVRDSAISGFDLLLLYRKLFDPSSPGKHACVALTMRRGGDSITSRNSSSNTSFPTDDDDDSYLESLIGSVNVTEVDVNDTIGDDDDDIMIESIMKKMSGRKKIRERGIAPIPSKPDLRDVDDEGPEQAAGGSHDDDQEDTNSIDSSVVEKSQKDFVESVDEDTVTSDSNEATVQISEDTFLSSDYKDDERYLVLPREQLLQSPVIRTNAIYRFFLRQGSIGHVLVMLFVLVSEWFSLYVPPLTNFVSLLLARILPQSVEDDYLYHRPEKKLSRKERILQTKYDDEIALQQLKGLDKKAAKYRYVSDDFLRRHELGPYSKTKVKSLNDFSSLMVKEQKGRKSKEALLHPKLNEKGLVKEEDDVDWVVEALTVEKNSRPRPFLQPSISIGSSSKNGGSIGIEFGFGSTTSSDSYDRRSAIAQAVAADERRRRRSVTPREKSSSGSTAKDSILDKFRDLTGTDSVMLSRSLLGAYPGDAVSIQDAASPQGVMELARKYGWGEWSDDGEEDTANLNSDELETAPRAGRKQRKIKGKKKKQPSMDDFDLDFDDFTSPPSPDSSKSRLKNVRQPQPLSLSSSSNLDRRDEREASMNRRENHIPVSPILQRGDRLADTTEVRKVQRMIRPATKLLTDRREQLLTKLKEKHRRDEGF
jgi:hypothetical protein